MSMRMASKASDTLALEISRAIELARRRVAEGEAVVLVVPVGAKPESEADPSWKAEFLNWRRKGRTVKIAAELAGVSERHAYRAYKEDPDFAREWDLTMSCSRVRRERTGGP